MSGRNQRLLLTVKQQVITLTGCGNDQNVGWSWDAADCMNIPSRLEQDIIENIEYPGPTLY